MSKHVTDKERLGKMMGKGRDLLKQYEAIGPEGTFGACSIRQKIEMGERVLKLGLAPWMKAAADDLLKCE